MNVRIIISLVLCALLVGCKNEKPQTVIAGILPDLKNETITLIPIDEYFPGLTHDKNYLSVKTDSLGRFKFQFSQDISKFYQIIFNNVHLFNSDIYLNSGDSLYIEHAINNTEKTFSIKGKGSEKLKYITTDFSVFHKDNEFYQKLNSDQFTTEFDFKKFIDSIYHLRLQAINENQGIPSLLKRHHLNAITAERAQYLLEHLDRRNYNMNGEFGYFLPSKTYCNFLDSLNFNNEFANTTSAKMLTNAYIKYKVHTSLKGNEEDEDWWDKSLKFKFNYISSSRESKWKDLLALGSISEYTFQLLLTSFSTELQRFADNVIPNFSSKEYQKLFKSNILPFQNLANGKPAPDFELPDENGKMHRLSEFKGTIVYIDFWGTWCTPCIQEIPESIKLQDRFKKYPVTFLYIGLEDGKEDIIRWKEFISGKNEQFSKVLNNKNFTGVHLVAEKQLRNESISDYKLNFAPTHVLIDKNGKIVSARAKGPDKIGEEIELLLNKKNGAR